MSLTTEVLFIKAAILVVFACMVWEARSFGKTFGGGGSYLAGAMLGLFMGSGLVLITAGICLGLWFLFTA